jgi:hypothetical protein
MEGHDGCGRAAHLDPEMGLDHAPILGSGLNSASRFRRLAECLNGNTRSRRDVLVSIGGLRCDRRRVCRL